MKTVLTHIIDDFYERKLPTLVKRDKQFPRMVGKANVAMGMRRTGKTYFCYQHIHDLLEAGTPMHEMVYLNFEDDRLLQFSVEHFQMILDVYYGKFPNNRETVCHFFFDEIQRIEQWEVFIRRLLDTENVQIYLTGSSSKLLSSEIATSLRGRSLTTEIFPFSFSEFLRAHELFGELPQQFGAKTTSKLRYAIKEYLERGGFPEVKGIEPSLHSEILQGYIDSVILKDIIERHRVGNVLALKHLVHHIMHAPGGQFSVNKFYNTLKSMGIKCTKNSLYEYLDHLIDAYLFYRVPIHSRSEKSRRLNPAKIYVIDTGLLNAMTFRNAANHGILLENLVFMQLRRQGHIIEYVHPKSGGETDFFVRHPSSGKASLIQVCWDMSDQQTFQRELRGLQNAMEEFSIETGTIVTWDDEGMLAGHINIVPVWKWLL